jgi:hypothetical protein
MDFSSSYLVRKLGQYRRLHALLALPPLLVTLRINHAREGIFPSPRDTVSRRDYASQEKTRRLAIPQRSSQEAQSAAVIHGRLADVEREGCDGRVHEDAEVVAQVGASDAERPHGCQDEGVAGEEEGNCGVFYKRGEERWVCGLGGESFVVTVVVCVSRDGCSFELDETYR